MIKTYSEMLTRSTFLDRFEYLKLGGSVGQATAGFDRWINQEFYRSREWRSLRQSVILRDEGCDLGVLGYEIPSRALVHHINPLTVRDIVDGLHWILNPEYLVTVSHETHNAIHYGDASLLPRERVERSPGDTRIW